MGLTHSLLTLNFYLLTELMSYTILEKPEGRGHEKFMSRLVVGWTKRNVLA